jgi:anhydro-N-acetylmuramic acid kinase
MSGTSVDGVDAVLADFGVEPCRALARTHVAFSPELRGALNALQKSGGDEVHRGALAANALMDCCATAVRAVLAAAQCDARDVSAIGLHGQTIRHRPELGFTTQLANPSRLVEATNISVVADFRSRDVAAGGQGAPLVPAFHAAVFSLPDVHRVVINIGGIANITDLPPGGPVRGFDTGPGNTLMDAWCERHTGQPYDRNGAWAGGGRVIPELLRSMRAEPYFAMLPPKSTGRDRFHLRWLSKYVTPSQAPQDVQRTLLALTALTIAAAIAEHCTGVTEALVCGGGAQNEVLMREIEGALAPIRLSTTAVHGIATNEVESLAFAWLAREALAGRPGNVPTVTGARGPRILGAIYRA